MVQSGNNYFLDVTGSGTLGPEIKQGGVAVTPGSYVAVGAVQVGGGYYFAWKMVGSETFTIWSLDSQGDFVANIGNNLAGNSTALEKLRDHFQPGLQRRWLRWSSHHVANSSSHERRSDADEAAILRNFFAGNQLPAG